MSRVPPVASSVRTARRKTVGLAFTGAMLVILLATGVAQAVPVTVGFRDFAYDPGQASRATSDTQQSKLWFAGGIWYGGFYSTADEQFNIWRLDSNAGVQTWADTHILVDTRDRVHPDFLFDGTKLWSVSTKGPCTSTTNGCNDGIQVRRYTFNAGNPLATRFTLDAGFPSTIIGGVYDNIPPSEGGAETVTIARDATTVYVAWTRRSATNAAPSTTQVASSPAAGAPVWTAPHTINAGEDGQSNVSAIVSFGAKVGIFYTDLHAAGSDVGYFTSHTAGDPITTWAAPEIAVASSMNNQVSIKSDSAGVLYAAYKTGAGMAASAQISLLRRDLAGTWTVRGVSDVASANTRAQVAIDTTFNGGAGIVFVLMSPPETDPNGQIFYKSAPLTGAGALTFTLTGQGTRLIDSATDNNIEDATTTKQVLTQASGLVVSASDKTSKFYLHNQLALADAADNTGPTGSVVINGNPTPDTTKLTAATAVLSATDMNAVVQMRYRQLAGRRDVPDDGLARAPHDRHDRRVLDRPGRRHPLGRRRPRRRVCAQFQDFVGNWSAPVLDTITLDTTGPAGTVTINGGDATTTLATVSLDVTATDVSSSHERPDLERRPPSTGTAS